MKLVIVRTTSSSIVGQHAHATRFYRVGRRRALGIQRTIFCQMVNRMADFTVAAFRVYAAALVLRALGGKMTLLSANVASGKWKFVSRLGSRAPTFGQRVFSTPAAEANPHGLLSEFGRRYIIQDGTS